MSCAIPVRPKDQVRFRCRQCGNCCRNLKDQLMLEPLDAYRLAKFLRERGEATSIDTVYERHAHTDMLDGCLPIYLMNTVGPDDSCAFLQNGQCAVYEGRPHTCRVYPFSVHPGIRGKTFEFYKCEDQHAAHFSEGRVLVKDWFNQNFSKVYREFTTAEGQTLFELGRLLRKLDSDGIRVNLFYILHYRYYNYNLDQPFMPQYTQNMAALKQILQTVLGEV